MLGYEYTHFAYFQKNACSPGAFPACGWIIYDLKHIGTDGHPATPGEEQESVLTFEVLCAWLRARGMYACNVKIALG